MLNIPNHRLYQQKITHQTPTTAQSIVAHMGAIQAQDFAMSKWAVGIRLPHAKEDQIETALDAGELVRTHVLRPTWHLVSGQDVRWMLALSCKQIKAASASRDRELGLDAFLYQKANELIVKVLEGGKHMTREEVMLALEAGGISTNPSRAVHFMVNAEVDGLVCNGGMRGKEQTYALLDEKVPQAPMLHREEAIPTLALRYFTSHGPATLADFHWWSGLSMPDARTGLEQVKKQLAHDNWADKTYWFSESEVPPPTEKVFFLPAFDEYTVSYKDRSAVFAPQWHKEAITSNGIFKPIIIVDGQVRGIWKRTVQKNKVIIEPTFFDPSDALPLPVMQAATRRFGLFLGLDVHFKG
jgi:hypothetical protein